MSTTGWFDSSRTRAQWRLRLPGDQVPGHDVEISAEIPDGLELERVCVVAVPNSEEGWEAAVLGEVEPPSERESVRRVERDSVRVDLPQPDPDMLYIVEVDTVVEQEGPLTDGSAFTLAGTIDGERVEDTATVRDHGEGGIG